MQRVAHQFVEILKAKLPNWVANNFLPLVPTSQSDWTNNFNLEAKLAECEEPLKEQKCPFSAAKSICEHMISIFQPSYISKFALAKQLSSVGSRKLCGYTAGTSTTNSTTTNEVQVEQKSKSGSGSTISTCSNQMP